MGAAHLGKVVLTFVYAIILQVVLLHRCSLLQLPIIERLMGRQYRTLLHSLVIAVKTIW